MQVLHGLQHCLIKSGERVDRDQQATGDWVGECPPKVKAAQEAGPTIVGTMVAGKSYA